MTAAPVDLEQRKSSVNGSPSAPAPSAPAPSSSTGPTTNGQADNLASVTDVTGRIAGRQIIEQAKQLLMAQRGMTEPEAHRWIQKTSMDRRSPKLQVATGIVSALGKVGEKPSGTG